MSTILAKPLKLPCGAELPNRLAKEAMKEGLATPAGVPTKKLERLYMGSGLMAARAEIMGERNCSELEAVYVIAERIGLA